MREVQPSRNLWPVLLSIDMSDASDLVVGAVDEEVALEPVASSRGDEGILEGVTIGNDEIEDQQYSSESDEEVNSFDMQLLFLHM